MPLEQIAELGILFKDVEASVPSKPLQLGRMDAAIYSGRERAALEAVAAKVVPPETGRHRACLDDLHHGLRGDRVFADPGQGRGLTQFDGPRTR